MAYWPKLELDYIVDVVRAINKEPKMIAIAGDDFCNAYTYPGTMWWKGRVTLATVNGEPSYLVEYPSYLKQHPVMVWWRYDTERLDLIIDLFRQAWPVRY